jgi:O-antigen/teichoic acid export membrane protein
MMERKDSLETAASTAASRSGASALPPVLGRLLSGTFWLALRVPLQAVFALWTTRLVLESVGDVQWGAYRFAWGFGFFQFLFEFGASSALQRQISDAWTRGDRAGVDRSIACGMTFYTVVAVLQMAALLGVAYWALPATAFEGRAYELIVKLLWLQVATAPCYGYSVLVSSVLQAARRYDFVPRLELLSTIARFVVLFVGLTLRYDFFAVVVAQTAIQIGIGFVPGVWVMIRELGHRPHFGGARFADYKSLLNFSFYIALIQISVVLADKVDTSVLGFILADPGPANTVYDVVSKPFLQLRQTGWMLAYMVMPAVASLVAAGDRRGLERVKYDGTRLHIGSLLPVGLLAWIYAGPFLSLWIGNRLGHDQDAAEHANLMRFFLLAAIPLVLSVLVQVSIGLNKIKVIALAALAGSAVNLPVSCYLTARLGVAGVIWGTVITTLFSNLLVPGIYVCRELQIDLRVLLARTLSAPCAGGIALVAASWALRVAAPVTYPGTSLWSRSTPLLAHLTVGTLAYIGGYLLTRVGRADLVELSGKFLRPGRNA